MNDNKLVSVITFAIVVILLVGGIIIYLLIGRAAAPTIEVNNMPNTTETGATSPVNVKVDGTSAKMTAPSVPKTKKITKPPAITVIVPFSLGYISPIIGRIGTSITLHGVGFSATGNTVILNKNGAGLIKNVSSPDGKTISLKIPATIFLVNGTSIPVEHGTYDVSVRNAAGKVTNLVNFVVME